MRDMVITALTSALFVACASNTEPTTIEEPPATAQPTTTGSANDAGERPVPSATASAPLSPPTPTVSLEEAAKKYVADSSAAVAASDTKKYLALYASDAVFGAPTERGWQEQGPAEREGAMKAYFAAFTDLKLTYTRVIGRGTFAVAEWVFTGKHTGALGDYKASNKKVGYRGATLLTFGPDGKVKRHSEYFDMMTMMGQMGFAPKGAKVRPAEPAPTAPPSFHFATKDERVLEQGARTWLATASKGDTRELLGLATDDIVVSNQYMPADTKGKKALEKEMNEGTKAFVDQKVDIAICIAADDHVACEYTWTATWKGPAMGMKPTGKTGTVHSLEVLKVKDGKVAATWAYASGPEFAATFGIGGAP